ncbi:SET domain-containing protein [Rhizoclosmatium globosum]|uniref:SET domain-containing protein n=1 Tax=Rhizoclosmatium globosum TaxID=329046 RepID=A0A1Y2BZA1_9FUNG|nr:SET domain-containing protein [Rhizoclosmatium globosum]|eukprot:ORY40091.1 SET domain-containing protein [Rhizoclosmatium globosum]
MIKSSYALDGFTYRARNTLLGGESLGESSDYEGCCCEGSCGDTINAAICSCLAERGQAYRIDKPGCLDVTFPESSPIFECNINCSCSLECFNRVVGKGITRPFTVVETEGKGFALVSDNAIEKGQFVMEYAGEIIRADEARRRWAIQREMKLPNYIICVKEHTNSKTYRTNIDPSKFGNAARFINHSCSPNLYFRTVRVNSLVPSAALFAGRDIEAGEELSFDYGDAMGLVEEETDDRGDRIRCLCGSSNCRGVLPFDQTL